MLTSYPELVFGKVHHHPLHGPMRLVDDASNCPFVNPGFPSPSQTVSTTWECLISWSPSDRP